MSLQTLTLKCLACHILAKQHLTSTKSKHKTIEVNQPIVLVNKQLMLTTKTTSKNKLRKIA